MDAEDFDFNYEAGWELAGVVDLTDCLGVGIRYFEIDSWNDSIHYVGNDDTGTAFADAEYESLLRSGEINGRLRWNETITFLAGFRYLNLEEALYIEQSHSYGTVIPEELLETQNDLYGGQIGADGTWSFGDLIVQCVGKVGVFHNSAEGKCTVFSPGGVLTETVSADETACVAELGLMAQYFLTQNISLIGGWQLLWVDGVALASEQDTTGQSKSTTFTTEGDVLYHGGFIGAGLSW